MVRAIEAGGSCAPLWQALEATGFLELLASEADGGAQLPLGDRFPILCTFGRYTMPAPAAQSIAARALVPSHAIPVGMIALAAAFRREAGGIISCPLTPYGMVADFVLARDGDALLLLPTASARRQNTGVHLSQTATLSWSNENGGPPLTRGAAPPPPPSAPALAPPTR